MEMKGWCKVLIVGWNLTLRIRFVVGFSQQATRVLPQGEVVFSCLDWLYIMGLDFQQEFSRMGSQFNLHDCLTVLKGFTYKKWLSWKRAISYANSD